MQISMIRFIFGLIFILAGMVIFAIQLFGVFKYKYALNRMHAAAMGDTLGISLCLIGVMIFYGFSFTTLKLALIAVFLWFSSPVSSHLIASLQVEADENLESHLTKCSLEEINMKEGEDLHG